MKLLKEWGQWLPNSIKKRTLMLSMSVLVSMSIVLSIVGIVSVNHEIEELFDARLAQQARLLGYLVGHDIDDIGHARSSPWLVYPDDIAQDEEDDNATGIGHRYEGKIYFSIWRNHKLAVASDPRQIEPENMNASGFGTATSDHHKWRTFELDEVGLDDESLRIVVAERLDVRDDMVREIVWNSTLPEVVGWFLIALLVWLAVSLGLSPLKQLADRIRRIEPAQLKPVCIENVPTELAPVQQALNTLLDEIDALMAREKRWIADAAHELRTPLAILKLHAQNAASATSEEDRQQALDQLITGVDRSVRIVAQLLSYARVESQLQTTECAPIEVLKVTRRIVADLCPVVWDKQISIEIDETSEEVSLAVDEQHLEIMLQNFVSNAIKFTPAGGIIFIGWHCTKNTAVLEFSDTGSGVSEEDIGRLTERFFRASDHSGGAGLGLSIVSTLVRHYGADLSFGTNLPSGLIVRVSFPC